VACGAMRIGLWANTRRRGRAALLPAVSEVEGARLPGGAGMAAVWHPESAARRRQAHTAPARQGGAGDATEAPRSKALHGFAAAWTCGAGVSRARAAGQLIGDSLGDSRVT
jgi:hypothetical protein